MLFRSPSLCENLVQSHRLEIPVHTTHIVNLISASNAVQIRGVVYLEVRFIREVGVCVKMDCLMAMAVVHGDEVMGKNDSFLRAVFQGHTDIVIVLQTCQSFLGFGVVKETVMVSLDEDDLTIETFNEALLALKICSELNDRNSRPISLSRFSFLWRTRKNRTRSPL